MWMPTKCCHCMSLRVGTLVLGWLGVIFGAFHVLSLLRVVGLTHQDFVSICGNISETKDQAIDDVTCANIAIGLIAISGVMTGLNIIINVLLLMGVQKNKHQLMLPYLIWQALGILISAILILAILAVFIYYGSALAAIIFLVIMSPIMMLSLYLFLVVYACYEQVKMAGTGMDSTVPYVEQKDALFSGGI